MLKLFFFSSSQLITLRSSNDPQVSPTLIGSAAQGILLMADPDVRTGGWQLPTHSIQKQLAWLTGSIFQADCLVTHHWLSMQWISVSAYPSINLTLYESSLDKVFQCLFLPNGEFFHTSLSVFLGGLRLGLSQFSCLQFSLQAPLWQCVYKKRGDTNKI